MNTTLVISGRKKAKRDKIWQNYNALSIDKTLSHASDLSNAQIWAFSWHLDWAFLWAEPASYAHHDANCTVFTPILTTTHARTHTHISQIAPGVQQGSAHCQ